MFSPRVRNLALLAHVIASVGWLGTVLVFVVLAAAGMTSTSAEVVRGSYVAMDVVARYAIVPLCLASLATGIVVSLGTKWGLLRHYWVVIKLVLTVLATAFLLLHMRPIGEMAGHAAAAPLAAHDHHGLRVQLIVDASAALVVLLVATTLAIYKPRGMTRYGRRRDTMTPV